MFKHEQIWPNIIHGYSWLNYYWSCRRMETFISMWYDASATVHLEPIIATFTTFNQTDIDSRAIYSSEKN